MDIDVLDIPARELLENGADVLDGFLRNLLEHTGRNHRATRALGRRDFCHNGKDRPGIAAGDGKTVHAANAGAFDNSHLVFP